ncbi:MAG: DUF4198 domain-containing protein [Candidatus Brocadiaceae bacterium]|nr:DUF4198 domain-containing protein [Candidatus Brocadiaceae bacterium]
MPIFYFALLGISLFNSCAQTPPYEHEINIFVNPYILNVHSGSEDKVYIEIVNKQGKPLPGMKIEVANTHPTVATVTKDPITDKDGKATVLVHGNTPGSTRLIFSAAGQTASVYVVFVEH